MIKINILDNEELEEKLEDLWEVWIVYMFDEHFNVILHLGTNRFNTYLPFYIMNRSVIKENSKELYEI